MDRPPTTTRSQVWCSSRNAVSTQEYQSSQRVWFISCQVVPCPGRRGDAHRVAPVGEVLAPRAHALRRAGEAVAQQHADVGSVMIERFGPGQNGHRFTPEFSKSRRLSLYKESSHDRGTRA